MKRFSHSAVGVQSGQQVLFSAFEDGGPMWSGEGPRHSVTRVMFADAFLDVPIVQVSIQMWDIRHGANHRVDISAENITAEGFDIVFRTWGDTRIARVRAGWLAIGATLHEDDFDLR
ncbi:MAG: H-type lectin domain-containing protein [Paracoccus sp. (in: a-proteobacteria)]|nr:H-type lectin domain-containing protein [Paracoccus sp. (in: a-proteobacteria)]